MDNALRVCMQEASEVSQHTVFVGQAAIRWNRRAGKMQNSCNWSPGFGGCNPGGPQSDSRRGDHAIQLVLKVRSNVIDALFLGCVCGSRKCKIGEWDAAQKLRKQDGQGLSGFLGAPALLGCLSLTISLPFLPGNLTRVGR